MRLRDVSLLAMVTLGACTTDVPDVPPGFSFAAAAASTSGVTSKTSRCELNGQFRVSDYDSLPASFTMDLRVSRVMLAHGGIEARRDTIFFAVPVTSSAPDSAHLALQFGPPLNDSLVAPAPPQLSRGVLGGWTCTASFPFGGDSVLNAHGYATVPAPGGNWSLTAVLLTF